MFRKAGLIFVLSLLLSGCGAMMPYKTEFQCKSPDKGKCATVKAAYDESKAKVAYEADAKSREDKKNDIKDGGSEKTGGKKTTPAENTKDLYRDKLQKELSGLLEAPVTPVIIPPKVMRVLIFPYPDKTLLYMPRYIYMMVDEPEWVIGNYLIMDNGPK